MFHMIQRKLSFNFNDPKTVSAFLLVCIQFEVVLHIKKFRLVYSQENILTPLLVLEMHFKYCLSPKGRALYPMPYNDLAALTQRKYCR